MDTTRPSTLKLTIAPHRRFEAINVAARFTEVGELLRRHQRALFCSLHTTAGYLDPSLSLRMHNRYDLVSKFFRAFRALFPEGAEYQHDQLDRRTELSDAQRSIEPRNGDSHLTFIGARMRNCVTQRANQGSPVYFIDLDGQTRAFQRERSTTVIGYDRERIVAQRSVIVPVSKHPIDSVNLADPRLGLVDTINELLRKSGIEHARVDLIVDAGERNVGLTVNEYETMLIKHDLVEVLRDPFRFARLKGRHMIDDPLSIPGKTLSYAQYDAVRILNSFMEAFRLDQSSFEKLIAKMASFPARCFFRSRRVSFMAAPEPGQDAPQLVRGTYQSPILVQWKSPSRQARNVDVNLIELS
jgi:thiamine phosphate synthase YjbQ (UPF0047 family)